MKKTLGKSFRRLAHNTALGVLVSLLLFAFGIVLLPQVTAIGESVLHAAIALLLALYLVFYLFDELRSAVGGVRIATVTEFVLLAFLALALILEQFGIALFARLIACQILGIVLWLRGISIAIRGYFLSSPEGRKSFPLLLFCAALALVTLGTYIFAKPIIKDSALVYCISALAMIFGVSLFVCAVAYGDRRPKRERKAKRKKSNQSVSKR